MGVRVPLAVDGGPLAADGGPLAADGGPLAADGGPLAADGGPAGAAGWEVSSTGASQQPDAGAGFDLFEEAGPDFADQGVDLGLSRDFAVA